MTIKKPTGDQAMILYFIFIALALTYGLSPVWMAIGFLVAMLFV